MQRVKYPLTAEAKEAARYLVDAWNKPPFPQYFAFEYHQTLGGNGYTHMILGELPKDFQLPPLNVFQELSKFRLIYVEEKVRTGSIFPQLGGEAIKNYEWHILLMQELRNAVENDFAVSDYFLTFNAVGTIIQGDATISAPFQSSASIYGDISQQITSSELADKLLDMLGNDMLRSDPQLNDAIQELRISLDSERQSKLGKIISQLGRCLEHANNAKGVIEAIAFVSIVLSQTR